MLRSLAVKAVYICTYIVQPNISSEIKSSLITLQVHYGYKYIPQELKLYFIFLSLNYIWNNFGLI